MNFSLAILAAIAVRNPFWPIGYEGEKEVITAEPRVLAQQTATETVGDFAKTAVETVVDETKKHASAVSESKVLLPRHWTEARKSLRITGSTTVTAEDGTKKHCVLINVLTYGDGYLISVNHDGRRFTWRIQGLTEGASLKLQRVRAKDIEEDDNSKGDK